MSDTTNRSCPFCTEAIKPQARICPHCRQWLTFRSLRHPLISTLMVGIPMLLTWVSLGSVIILKLDWMMNPTPYFSEFPDSLEIVEARMNWVETKDGLRIYVTGIVTNQSAVAWRDLDMECRFYDVSGRMIDADHRPARVTVHAFDDAAFRATFLPGWTSNEYASFKLSVSTARNTKSRF